MTEAVAFADVEAVMVGYLQAELANRGDSARVATQVPGGGDPTSTGGPGRFVYVERAGGVRSDLVTDRPMVIFQCWDRDTVAASNLCRLVRALVGSAEGSTVGGVWVRKVVEVGGPSFMPDPTTGSPRYQFVAEIHTRGTVL